MAGLLMAEAEFDNDELMRNFATPDFALREVTDDLRFTGPLLALHGLPAEAGIG